MSSLPNIRLAIRFTITILTVPLLPAASVKSDNDCLSKCHQKCHLVTFNNSITCFNGFHVNSDNETCAPNDPDWTLFLVTTQSVASFQGNGDNLTSLKGPEYLTKDNDISTFLYIASDVRNQDVYWSNIATREEGVYKISVNNSGNPSDVDVIVDAGVFYPVGVAYDWITGNLYFADQTWRLIAVCALNPTKCAVVIKEAPGSRIRDIALHPNEGIMFWTDEGQNEAIKKANMDGSNVTTIVSAHLDFPRGIIVDESTSRLYWTDLKHEIIESSRFDGSDRQTIARSASPFGIDIFGNTLFWTDTDDEKIRSINKFGGSVTTISDIEKPRGLTVMHITKQPMLRENSCKTASCSDICTFSGRKDQCLCPVGMMLINGSFCLDDVEAPKILLAQQNVLLVMRVNTIGKDVFEQIDLPPQNKAINALVYNPINNSVIISDHVSNKVFEFELRTNETRVLVEHDLVNVTLIDFDPVSENLFWLDASKQTLEVLSLTTGTRLILLSDIENVHDLLFVAEHGRLYYSKASGNHEDIHKVVFSGTVKDTIVHSFRNLHEGSVHLKFDHKNNQLLTTLWNGTHVLIQNIFASGFEYQSNQQTSGPVHDSIQINNQIFWVDKTDKLKVLTVVDAKDMFLQYIKVNHITISNITSDFHQKILAVVDRKSSHQNQLRRRHQCSTGNPNRKVCSHICLPSNIKLSGECWCPRNFNLNADGVTCIEEDVISTESPTVDEAENVAEVHIEKVTSTTLSTLQLKASESEGQSKISGACTIKTYTLLIIVLDVVLIGLCT